MLRKTLTSFIFALLLCIPGFAQSNEIGVVIGTTLAPDNTPPAGIGACPVTNPFCGQTLHTESGITYEGVLAHRIANAHIAELYLEFPVVGSSGVLTVRSPTSGRWCPARCRSILEAGSRQAV